MVPSSWQRGGPYFVASDNASRRPNSRVGGARDRTRGRSVRLSTKPGQFQPWAPPPQVALTGEAADHPLQQDRRLAERGAWARCAAICRSQGEQASPEQIPSTSLGRVGVLLNLDIERTLRAPPSSVWDFRDWLRGDATPTVAKG
jgi:hypothetical protein